MSAQYNSTTRQNQHINNISYFAFKPIMQFFIFQDLEAQKEIMDTLDDRMHILDTQIGDGIDRLEELLEKVICFCQVFLEDYPISVAN